jgi:regulator of RNase E activity RraB
MYAQWLNDLFDRDYDNVMNRVIEYVSYDGGGNYSGDANNTDDDDDDNNENDDDKKGEPF